MLKKRIIPCLDIKDGKVVKGIHFNGLKEVGDPVELARCYDDQGADEIVFLDITATYENRDTMYALVEEAAGSLSIPLAIGGGVRHLDDFRKVLLCGADKISINSAAIRDPELINQAAQEFGSQCVVVAIDAKKNLQTDRFEVYIKGGRENTGIDLVDWAKECQQRGAGEILLTSMDKDGTQSGYDIDMLQAVCAATHIPIIASGGCGSIEDIVDVFKKTDCDAALVASLFHYGVSTINEVKERLKENNIPVR
ncbi:imidazole glycerol phosphate synthase subunit HisF [Beduini massiliensis]|uniref:imidazole glycerol phosphate synthase subunit HisF n=1 Tax=Beduini massiliensis TaxID=1585974 RepID=UPI00059A8E6F|nr:imidazole glycerol phosphate synthase subunit HisF [Beduini massiliensis]